MKQRQYKCGFSHCEHGGKVNLDEAVKIGARYWHKDCYETSELVKEIKDDYLENISSSAVISFLSKVINDIVYGKKLENKKLTKAQSNLEAARYLSFCLKYAINHSIPITHVPGLYYLIDNVKIRKEYEKELELKVQKEIKQSIETEEVSMKPIDLSEGTKKQTQYANNTGFGSIFGGTK